MALVDHEDVELASGKAFDGTTTPTDTEVDTLCTQAEEVLRLLLGFALVEETLTDELYTLNVPTKKIVLKKYPLTSVTKVEERRGVSYTELTEGPEEDYIVHKELGMIQSTSGYGYFESGEEAYRITYNHGVADTDDRYKVSKQAVTKLAMIAVITAENGGEGSNAISAFSVGGLSVTYNTAEQERLLEELKTLVKIIRGDARPYGN